MSHRNKEATRDYQKFHLKENQTELSAMKNVITEIKKSMDKLSRKLEAEERITKLEDRL